MAKTDSIEKFLLKSHQKIAFDFRIRLTPYQVFSNVVCTQHIFSKEKFHFIRKKMLNFDSMILFE